MNYLNIPIHLLDNVTIARVYWNLLYTGYEEVPTNSELRQAIEMAIDQCDAEISKTYGDYDVRYDFLESVRQEVVD